METRVIATIALVFGNVLLTAGGSATAQENNTKDSLGKFAEALTIGASGDVPLLNEVVLAENASSQESASDYLSVGGCYETGNGCCETANGCAGGSLWDKCFCKCQCSLGDEFHAHTPWDIGPLLELPNLAYSAPLQRDMWRLQDAVAPDSPIYFGGWLAAGYHNKTTRQSFQSNDLLSYNDLPHQLNLHQAWLYIGKLADGSEGFDYGFRTDIVYGTDAQALQATGSPSAQAPGGGSWDASLDHGAYGWAVPQLYGEVVYNNFSILGGYFLTPIGYETSTAPDRFFYSRSLTMYNSEPFTHTGVLASYSLPNSTIYAGWTLGWDSAFQQFLGGNAFLGGISVDLNDYMVFNYFFNVGDLGWRGDDGYTHSLVLLTDVTDRLGYVVQSDYVSHSNSFGTQGVNIEEYGVNQYLYYTINKCLTVGTRLEWWNSNAPTGDSQSYYEATFGVNIRPHRNVVFRPEIRYDWTPDEAGFANNQTITPLANPSYNQWTLGMDCVVTF